MLSLHHRDVDLKRGRFLCSFKFVLPDCWYEAGWSPSLLSAIIPREWLLSWGLQLIAIDAHSVIGSPFFNWPSTTKSFPFPLSCESTI